ncbi:CDP-glucose 4,6-dehydratase [Deltaproteobacteria bacterium]|nr:CDP-glucose 4,6-dehydratase [Deltaproteobacteria bacterium]
MATFDCFNDQTVLVTGHTGFKGSWLTLWLKQLNANVVGVSIDIPSKPSHFEAANISNQIEDYRLDIRERDAMKSLIQEIQPDFIFHLAAQALVRYSYDNPIETIEINALGSVNVLDALRKLEKPVIAVMITSDKVYDNVEWVWGYRETDRLGGKDPYSASKGMAELAIRSYIEAFFNSPDSNIRVGITRAGNVIGGGDWGPDRIVPDCMKAWSRNKVVDIRNPAATRPWQHVLEPLSGYLTLAADLARSTKHNGEAYNFGPPAHQNHSVRDLIDEMKTNWKNVRWNDISHNQKHLHETELLKINCDKALSDLEWLSTLQFDETVRMTVEWYKRYYQGGDSSMYKFTNTQIEEYTHFAKKRNMEWAK